jgi:hypothetical protein
MALGLTPCIIMYAKSLATKLPVRTIPSFSISVIWAFSSSEYFFREDSGTKFVSEQSFVIVISRGFKKEGGDHQKKKQRRTNPAATVGKEVGHSTDNTASPVATLSEVLIVTEGTHDCVQSQSCLGDRPRRLSYKEPGGKGRERETQFIE